MAEKKAAMDWKSPETQYKASRQRSLSLLISIERQTPVANIWISQLAMSALASLEAPAFSAAKMATYMGKSVIFTSRQSTLLDCSC